VAGAGLAGVITDPGRVAVVLGTGSSAELSREAASIRIYHRLRNRLPPGTAVKVSVQTATGRITMDLGARGPAIGLATGCAAATHAVALGCLLLRQRLADCVVAGGADAPVVLGTMMAFDALHLLTQDVCRPFSAERRGLALAEGAGMVVLERAEDAVARGAPIQAQILGLGMSSDAADFVHPTVEGPARAMRLALADAGLSREQITYVNAHGTGTRVNDRVETAAIREVFGDHAPRLAVSSTKSMHGHALGAAGGLELIATVLALREQLLPPTVNYLATDLECDLDFVVEGPRPARADYALTNSFAFGGLNAVLAVGKAA
jgi:nodulation protein E